MPSYTSDGKKLINTEYDTVVQINDMVDGMMVISVDKRAEDEYAIFLQNLNGTVSCYVLDEVFILGSVSGFDNLIKAVEAWNANEI